MLIVLVVKAQTNNSKLLPSEALILMYNAVDLNPDKERIENTRPFQARVITEGLSDDEVFYLGETYFWNFMPKEAEAAYKNFLEEDSPRGRASWQRYLQIQFRAFNQHEFVEEQIKAYREKFKAIPEDRYGMFGQIYNVADRYRKMGEHEKVVQLIKDEWEYLNRNGAYASFQLPAYFIDSFNALGKNKEAIDLLAKAKEGLEKTLQERKAKTPENEFQYVVHSRPVSGMDTIMTEKLSHSQMSEKFEWLITSLSKAIEKYSE